MTTVSCSHCGKNNHHSLLHSDKWLASQQPASRRRGLDSTVAGQASSHPSPGAPCLSPGATAFTPSTSVNQRLVQLSTSNPADNSQRQVNVSALETNEHKDSACLRPIVAVKVISTDGRSDNVYCLLEV